MICRSDQHIFATRLILIQYHQEMYDPLKPFNSLSMLPPKTNLKTSKILEQLVSAASSLSELKGWSGKIPNENILVNSISLQEAKASSEIENIFTTNDRLYRAFSSNNLQNVDPQIKEILSYRSALWEGYKSLSKRPLSTNSFIDIVQVVKQNNLSIRKTPGTTITGSKGVIYTPPVGELLIRDLLSNLETYIHSKNNHHPLVKMAVMHYQFEAIHPFHDGNGRTGRILNILYLVEQQLLSSPILYLSRYIIENKNEYYSTLHNVTRKNAWEEWVLYILKAVDYTALYTLNKLKKIYDALQDTIELCKSRLPNHMYSKELIELLFEQPYCKIKFLVDNGIAKRQTAEKYLQELDKIGVLKKSKVGRENLFLNILLFKILSEVKD